jgi:hypothetical protein
MGKRSMNEINQVELQNMAIPIVNLKQHKVQLKTALLSSSRPENNTNSIREALENLMSKKRLVLSGAALVITALAISAISLFGTQSPYASAEQLTKQSISAVGKLSPSQLQQVNAQVHGNAEAELLAAENSKNLTILTYAQLEAQGSQSGIVGIPNPLSAQQGNSGPQLLNLKDLKYLRYTDANGTVHTIGVDAQGVPVIEMASNTAKGFQSGSVMVNGSTSQGQNTSANGPLTVTSGGNVTTGGSIKAPTGTSCATQSSGAVTCSASGSATVSGSGSVSSPSQTSCVVSAAGVSACANSTGPSLDVNSSL